MSSQIDICNMALFHIGSDVRITSLTEGTKEARACNLFYEQTRQMSLVAHPWGFAKKVDALALLSSGNPKGFDLAYQLPSDCLFAREISQGTPSLGELDYVVVGRELWTDVEDAELVYTYDATDVNQMSPLFATAFSHRLALVLAMPITKNVEVRREQFAAYMGSLSEAKTIDAREQHDSREKTSDLIAARG